MHKTLTLATLAVAVCTAGCQLTHVKTPEWEASLRSHWFKRDVDKLEVQRNADGSYSVSLNGYHSDASEQFNQMLQQSFQGLALLGRLAGAAVNPAVASVPLTTEAADPDAVAKIQREVNSAKVELARIKEEASVAKAKLAAGQKDASSISDADASACPGGVCEPK